MEIKTPKSEIRDAFEIAADGGMIYNPLSREAALQGKLHKYDDAQTREGMLILPDGTRLNYQVPTEMTAYDMVPVRYRMTPGSGEGPVHVEATSSEDAFRKGDMPCYDTTLPGHVELKYEFLGYITAEPHPERRPQHSPDCLHDEQGTRYPHYTAKAPVLSSVIPSSPYMWYRFRYTNVGDTILDSDGGGTFVIEPRLEKKNENGEWYTYYIPSNIYYRILGQVYPGESGEVDFIFTWDREGKGSKNPPLPGDYRIVIQSEIRNETKDPENYMTNIWGGRVYETSSLEFRIAEQAEEAPVPEIVNEVREVPLRNEWLHTYEEFMTSFDSWLKPEKREEDWQTLYVQPAPWTTHLTLKLMRGNGLSLASTDIPVRVETDSIHVRINTQAKNFVRMRDGTRYPAMATQSMCDMRVNTSLGPDAAATLISELLDMKECGVNLVTTTAAFETDMVGKKAPKDTTDANWFMADAIRVLDMRMEGYVTYPYGTSNNINKARWITGDAERFPERYPVKSVADPVLAEANGVKTVYQYRRWGDNYFRMDDGTVPVTAEDSRGWMRVDISSRNVLSEEDILAFQNHLKEKYGNIEELNKVWGKTYSGFDRIRPDAGAELDHGGWSFAKSAQPEFEEWSPAANDLDIFRTKQRVDNYRVVLGEARKVFPGCMGIRTEGGNFTSVVPFDTENQHYRHVYYSQRRCALIPEILSESGLVCLHSDYYTIPYTPSELSDLTVRSVSLGILPVTLGQIDRLRDIAVNPKFGQDYAKEYNLTGPNTKGVYVNTVRSLFESYKAIYEAGGIPGILWEDYLCDGFTTETQQKEMKFFSEKIAEAMQDGKAQAWSNEDREKYVLKEEDAVFSYPPSYVRAEIERVRNLRKA